MRKPFLLCVAFILLWNIIITMSIPLAAQTAFCHGDREEKYISLTFDDGPHPKYTDQILALLEQYGIKATFFMIGSNVASYPEVAKRVQEKGHEIGAHTYSHPHMKKISLHALAEELTKSEKVFAEYGLPKPALFRPPEGFRSPEQVRLLEERGYRVVIWSLDTKDWQGRPSSHMVSQATSYVQGGDVLLFHDYISGQNTTITAIEELIPKLLADGYHFVTVSELINRRSDQSVIASSFFCSS